MLSFFPRSLLIKILLTIPDAKSYKPNMRWIGLFNLAYGSLGLLAALYIGRSEMIVLCLWVMACGIILRSLSLRRTIFRLRSVFVSKRLQTPDT